MKKKPAKNTKNPKNNKVIANAFKVEYKRQLRLFGILAAVAVTVTALAIGVRKYPSSINIDIPDIIGIIEKGERKGSQWGEFLAGIHAMNVGDFEAMRRFSEAKAETESKVVREAVMRAAFMSGGDLSGIGTTGERTLVPLAIEFAAAAQRDDWAAAWKSVGKHDIFILTPARIVAATATGRPDEAQKIARAQKNFPDLRNFNIGFAYAIAGYPRSARKYFRMLPDEFLNLNDFLFIRAFYLRHNMQADADALTERFRSIPRGSFIADIRELPDWSNYNTRAKQARYGLTSIVAQHPFMLGTGWGLVALRTAENSASGNADDALNYYLGVNFSEQGRGKYFFNKIPDSSPFKPFVMIHLSDSSIKSMEKVVRKFPSFVPATARLALMKAADNDLRGALAAADRALDNAVDASPATTAYLLKLRAHVNFLSGELHAALNDINEASILAPKDRGLMADKVRIWSAMGTNLDEAYALAGALIRSNPLASDYWDAMGVVLTARGEIEEALRILERVQRAEPDVSSYAENFGDALAADGQIKRAKEAYRRAISLASDGQINARAVRKKMNKLK
ncbi:MAG: tetratricopeptide repeat protein [Alphaproteobacteria bacterium]|nr:tetratricopeptide repeat protein [Alphaproteobacteria bacterium]